MILMIDNYDSFTYNLVQYLKQIGEGVQVKRNDAVSVDEIAAMAPQAIVISPGPGRPESAGVSMDTIKRFSGRIPILGVCLGHQSIAHVFGGRVIGAKRLMHGKTSAITGDGQGIFTGIKQQFQAMRYHSLAVEKESLPDCLAVTATSEDGEIMGIRHRSHITEGIQFHPESIMTPLGKRLLRNFLKMIPDGAPASD
jgi:anthranilate synthase/aminodeoxychorismate synthase-like glutamine amidotransferase